MEDDVRAHSVIKRLLGVERAVIDEVALGDEGLVVHARLHAREQNRCAHCGRRSPRYDRGRGRRRWRALDFGSTPVYLEAAVQRVKCKQHGVVIGRVPWARRDSGFTQAFEDQVAWLMTNASASVVAQLMRVAWRTVARILTRTVEDANSRVDLLANVRRIGIDETSYRRGHRYLLVVVCHDTGRLLWAAEGRNQATLQGFFDALGAERCALVTHVSCDAAAWIHACVKENAPQAVICMDAFHVVQWVNEAVDEVRRKHWNEHRDAGAASQAVDVKGTRWALLKAPEKLSERQRSVLSEVERLNRPLYRAYLLKEHLRVLLKRPAQEARASLDQWLVWASNSRLKPMLRVARSIRRVRAFIDATLEHGLSNGRVESVNAKIRLLQQRAFGFRHPSALIALAKLTLSGFRPALPGRG
jgi:transposase